MRARWVFDQQNGDVTKAYYAELNAKGLAGQLATALFRAQKRSTAAKKYKGGRFTRDAYDVKNWSLSEVCRILTECEHVIKWGWGEDSNTPIFSHVLFLELPHGQISFHSAVRLQGPDYKKDWDGVKGASEIRILQYCDDVMGEPNMNEQVQILDCQTEMFLEGKK